MKKFGLFACLLFLVVACATKPTSVVSAEFSTTQKQLILSGGEDASMRVFKINNPQDSILLRTKSIPVDVRKNKEILGLLIERMKTTMIDSVNMGVGIAAPQVGVLKQVIVVQRFDKENFPIEGYINPVIVQYSKRKQTRREGCLSIPGRRDTLRNRAYAILLEYDSLDGTHHTEMVEDFTAIIFQHEIDHLNGILYIDHLQEEINNSKH